MTISIYTQLVEARRNYIGGMPQSSIMKWTSDIQRPVTLSLIRTSSGPISGTGKSWTSIYNDCVNVAGTGNDKHRMTYVEVGTRITNYASLASLWDDRRSLLHTHSLSSRHDCNRI